MSLLDKILPKCKICKSRGPDRVVLVPYHGHYGEEQRTWKYHDQCLKDVLADPEKHSHQTVDTALEILECIQARKKKEVDHVAYLERKREDQLNKVNEVRLKILEGEIKI